MPRSRIINHDDDLHVRLGGRQGPGAKVWLPSLGKTTSRPAVKAIVKVGYMRASRVKGYAQYIERDGTAGPTRDGTTATQGYSGYIARDGAGEDGQRAELFTRVGQVVDRETFVERSQGDPRAWTIIVSPGSNNLDMERYIREFMVQVELDLGKKLDYLAAIHRNTKFTHAHILMRGKDRDGRGFRLPQEYMTHGLRTRATEIARLFRALGYVRELPAMGRSLPDHGHFSRRQHTLDALTRQHAREGRV